VQPDHNCGRRRSTIHVKCVDHFNLPSKGSGWRTARGNLGIWAPAPGIVLVQLTGYGEEEYASHIINAIDSGLESGARLKMFYDMEAVSSYDSALRTKLTSRFLECRKEIDALVVIARSRLVSMGIAVANLALGGIIKLHEDHAAFAAAFEAELRKSGVVGFSIGVLHTAASRTAR
jgi:hypothetical protein